MADSKEHQILDKLRARLTAGLSGWTVYLGKSIDAENDDLPAVTAVVSEPFSAISDNANSRKQVQRWRGIIDIQGDAKVPGDDPLVALMDHGASIRKAIYTPDNPTMDGVCTEHRPVALHPLVPVPGSIIGSVLVRLQVEYTEDYGNV